MEVWQLLVSQLLLLLHWAEAESLDAATCLSKGFNSAKLLCSSCQVSGTSSWSHLYASPQDLGQFDLAKVMPDCESCCQSDGGASTLDNVKYEKAILEVCG